MAASKINYIDLSTISVDIEDISFLSQYFNITEFNPTLGAGKNLLIITPTSLLSSNPNIQIQCVDSKNNLLNIDKAIVFNSVTGTQQYYYSLEIDDTIFSGAGKLTIVGNSINNKLIRWTANVVIDTNSETKSKITFVTKPELKVFPLITYVLGVTPIVNYTTISGSLSSIAINPPKDFDITNNYNKNKLDYRIIDNNAIFSSSLVNFPINLNISSIKSFGSSNVQNINDEASILIQDIVNSNTLKLADPYVYQNNKISEIVSATYTCSYNEINYNSAYFFTSSYATQSTDFYTGFRYVKNSYALIGYTNLETFSGKIQRHKIYKKSLSKVGDFQLITDELFDENEMLADITTPNKAFQNLGTFFNQFHINNFWFTSSNAFNLVYDSSTFFNGMVISSSSPITGGYIIPKVNSSWSNRNETYIAYDATSILNFSGSSYDSNYLHFYPNTSYTLQFNAAFLNKNYNDSASLDFYITSSISSAENESTYVPGLGIKIGSINLSSGYTNYAFNEIQQFDFSLLNELHGGLVIYPNNFSSAVLSNISISPTKKYGFSQGTYFIKIPFDVNLKNEAFEIKAELYDKDGVLAYNDLFTIQYFDTNGFTTPINNFTLGTTLAVDILTASYLEINGNSYLNGQVLANGITSSLYGTSSWANNVKTASYLIYPNNSTASYAITASYSMNGGGGGGGGITTGSTYPITSSWAINSLTSSYLFLQNSAIFDYSSSNTNTTSTTILTHPTNSFNAVFFDYIITSASNFRAGTLICAFSGNNINYTEYSTIDNGNTNPVTMSAILSSGNIILNSNTPSGQVWNIKSIGRYL
jgi:hypothetical protein